MDSISQAALGAAVCYAAVGPRLGKRALITGAIVGTLPDLDVLVPYQDAVASFTYHRSWSHSLLVLSLVSFPLTWLIRRLTPADQSALVSPGRWWLAIWLVLVTHPLLDSFTIYGTQIWWPLPLPPVAIGSIFIIDPLYTLPLLIAGFVAWRSTSRQPNTVRARRVVFAGLAVSTLYLGWTLASQFFIGQRLQEQLRQHNINSQTVVIAPFPTALLWRMVVVNNDHYFETFASMLDDHNAPLTLTRFPNEREACERKLNLQSWAISRMDWFTHGAIAVNRKGERLLITDLRMGIEDDYVFEFDIGGWNGKSFESMQATQLPINFDFERISSLIHRISDQSIVISIPKHTAATTPMAC